MTDPRETRDDRGMIERPDLWPAWPLLPLKRYTDDGGLPDVGFLVAWERKRVFTGNIIGLRATEDLSDREFTDYADAESLLADGWLVD